MFGVWNGMVSVSVDLFFRLVSVDGDLGGWTVATTCHYERNI